MILLTLPLLLAAAVQVDAPETLRRCERAVASTRRITARLSVQLEVTADETKVSVTMPAVVDIDASGRMRIDMKAAAGGRRMGIRVESDGSMLRWVNSKGQAGEAPATAATAEQAIVAFARLGLMWTFILENSGADLRFLPELAGPSFPAQAVGFGPEENGKPSVVFSLPGSPRTGAAASIRLVYDPVTYRPIRREFHLRLPGQEMKAVETYQELVLGDGAPPAGPTPPPLAPVKPAPEPELSDDELETAFIASRMKVAREQLRSGDKDKAAAILRDVVKDYPKHQATVEARKLLESLK